MGFEVDSVYVQLTQVRVLKAVHGYPETFQPSEVNIRKRPMPKTRKAKTKKN